MGRVTNLYVSYAPCSANNSYLCGYHLNNTAIKEEYYIRFDWAVKRLLRQKANFGVLEGFLKTLLTDDIKIVEILESEDNQENESDKYNRMDIKAKDSQSQIIIVEIQNTREIYYLERVLYEVTKAITEHINIGDSYASVKKVYSISIVYFDLGKGDDYIYKGTSRFRGVNIGDELAITPFDECISYLNTGHIPPEANAPGLPEAREKLRYYDMQPAERLAYDRHLEDVAIQNDVLSVTKEEGLAEGEAKGLVKAKWKAFLKVSASL